MDWEDIKKFVLMFLAAFLIFVVVIFLIFFYFGSEITLAAIKEWWGR